MSGGSTSTCQAVISLQWRNHKGTAVINIHSSNRSIKTPEMRIMAVQRRLYKLNTIKPGYRKPILIVRYITAQWGGCNNQAERSSCVGENSFSGQSRGHTLLAGNRKRRLSGAGLWDIIERAVTLDTYDKCSWVSCFRIDFRYTCNLVGFVFIA